MRRNFDCVDLQHRGQERIGAKLAGMTREEELAYWRRCHAAFLARQKQPQETASSEADRR